MLVDRFAFQTNGSALATGLGTAGWIPSSRGVCAAFCSCPRASARARGVERDSRSLRRFEGGSRRAAREANAGDPPRRYAPPSPPFIRRAV